MAKLKRAFSVNQFTIDTIDEAGTIWPEFAGNRSALLCKVVADWQRNREENGGKSTRLEKRMLALEAEIADLKRMIEELKHDPTDYTDHA